MKKIEVGCMINSVKKGVEAVRNTLRDAADIRIKNQCGWQFRITSPKKEKDLFRCGFSSDKDVQMLKAAGIALAAVSVIAAAAVVGCARKDAEDDGKE